MELSLTRGMPRIRSPVSPCPWSPHPSFRSPMHTPRTPAIYSLAMQPLRTTSNPPTFPPIDVSTPQRRGYSVLQSCFLFVYHTHIQHRMTFSRFRESAFLAFVRLHEIRVLARAVGALKLAHFCCSNVYIFNIGHSSSSVYDSRSSVISVEFLGCRNLSTNMTSLIHLRSLPLMHVWRVR